ncbi:MAG: PEP-CTERM sorting domain-containing protein [Aquabacterium sp.]|nr:PEP-CTERM sorting domain-containing protein [Aquabacterium sp.]
MPKTLRPLAGALIAALAAAPLAAYAEIDTGTVPEPDSLWLVGLALGVMIWFGWRSRR